MDEGLQRHKIPESVGISPLFITIGNYPIQTASPFSVSHCTFTLTEPVSPILFVYFVSDTFVCLFIYFKDLFILERAQS